MVNAVGACWKCINVIGGGSWVCCMECHMKVRSWEMSWGGGLENGWILKSKKIYQYRITGENCSRPLKK